LAIISLSKPVLTNGVDIAQGWGARPFIRSPCSQMESTFSRGVQWIAKETLEGFHFIMANAASAPPWGEQGREAGRLIMGHWHGGYHTMCVGVNGGLWAWGAGCSGQLGLGNTNKRLVPTLVGVWRVQGAHGCLRRRPCKQARAHAGDAASAGRCAHGAVPRAARGLALAFAMGTMMMTLLLFLQKQNLASAIYLFGLGTRLS
jgi:hypothetical protein